MIEIPDAPVDESSPATVDTRFSAPFVLSRPHISVVATGRSVAYPDARAAAEALRTGAAHAVVGAIPFDPTAPAALWEPVAVTRTRGPMPVSVDIARLPEFRVESLRPSEDLHLRRIRRALTALSSETSPLRKVVLARAVRLVAESPVSAAAVLNRLIARDSLGNGFGVDLSPSGPLYEGITLTGASPELLVRRTGDGVHCHPLAGSAPRHPDPVIDTKVGMALLESVKDLREHAFVVDQVRSALSPLCRDITHPATPELTRTPKLWHLGTPVTAAVRDRKCSALDLALALHPTPAVCGTPTAAAMRFITEVEGDRRFYAGAVGWATADGDGEWMVSIRCAELSADRRSVLAFAGGGIVGESDPDSELAETTTKLSTVLTALGVIGH